MNIQSNINQSISLLGLLASQTPMAAARREQAAEQSRIKGLEKKTIKAGEASEAALAHAENLENIPGESGKKAAEETYEYALSEEITANEELFKARPDVKGAKSIISMKSALADYRQAMADEAAGKALQTENDRIARSNQIVKSLDISNIDERALPRLERAYKRAQRDTKYLTKGGND